MTNKTIEERFKKLSPREHVLKKPGMYVGNIESEPNNMFVFEDINDFKGNKFTYKEINYNAGFLKIFDEVLTNASDHAIRCKENKWKPVTHIKVTIDKDKITIENTGTGIPIQMHKEHKVYVPELIFGHLLSGENFDDNDQRLVGGTHGLGVKLTNIFSTKFIIETADGKKKYRQSFTNNLLRKNKPSISASNRNYTRITYYPDFEKFGLTEITNEMQSLFLRRVIDIAAYIPSVKVYYNSKLIPIRTFKDYIKMFGEEIATEEVTDRWEIGVAKTQIDNFQQVSMVNGVNTIYGGTHVNYVTNQIIKTLTEKLNRSHKGLNIKPNFIKNHLFVFVNCKIPNPSFENQTKERLMTRLTADMVKNFEISENFYKKIIASELKNEIVNFIALKEFQDAKKETGQNSRRSKLKILKLDDANKAGTNESSKCSLFLTEGDCLHEDTTITIIRNGEKKIIKIKDVKIDDAVITHKNNIGLINSISKKIEKIVKIKLSNNEILICSKKHRWYIYDKKNNKFGFIETQNINKEQHKLIINKNAFIDNFIEIKNIEKITDKKYNYLLRFNNGEDMLSSSNHKFSVFDKIDLNFYMLECEKLDKDKHLIVSYTKI